jgi:hypothetical protein
MSAPDAERPSRRPLTRAVAGILLFVAGLDLLLLAMGLGSSRSFVFLGIGAAFGLGACLLWEVVERARARGFRGTPLAWVAFPLALLLGFFQLPFLAISVYPPLEEQLFVRRGRVQAYFLERQELRLEVAFPELMEAGGNNLRLNSRPVPPGYIREHPELFQWLRAQVLSLSIRPIARDLGLGEVKTVGINDLRDKLGNEEVELFRTQKGERLPAQTVEVEPR